MKISMVWIALLWLVPCPAALADEDPFRAADVTDTSGTLTHVLGLHYCYEEQEGDSIYINKYDEFFVQRGEAIIRVMFKDLTRVKFLGAVEEKGDKRVRKARILTRAGNEVEAEILCHPGSFIKGRMALGEFSLDMDKINEMVFPSEVPEPEKGLEIILLKEDRAPEKAVRLALSKDGILGMDGRDRMPDDEKLGAEISSNGCNVVLEVAAQVPYNVLAQKLRGLENLGARRVYLVK
ncbi:MAG: hypothetical protein ACYTG7_23020 [Planctomycetota bacterium]|jgi:hypothetical protein